MSLVGWGLPPFPVGILASAHSQRLAQKIDPRRPQWSDLRISLCRYRRDLTQGFTVCESNKGGGGNYCRFFGKDTDDLFPRFRN